MGGLYEVRVDNDGGRKEMYNGASIFSLLSDLLFYIYM